MSKTAEEILEKRYGHLDYDIIQAMKEFAAIEVQKAVQEERERIKRECVENAIAEKVYLDDLNYIIYPEPCPSSNHNKQL